MRSLLDGKGTKRAQMNTFVIGGLRAFPSSMPKYCGSPTCHHTLLDEVQTRPDSLTCSPHPPARAGFNKLL